MGACDGAQARSCRLRRELFFPFGLFESSVSETPGIVISLDQVTANASACAGVFPWTHGGVGVDILLWVGVEGLLHKHVVLSLIPSTHGKSCM